MNVALHVSPTDLIALAAQRHGDPVRALAEADWIAFADAIEVGDEVRSLAQWVRGLALHELDQPAAAVDAFRIAIDLSIVCGSADAQARARANLAISLAQLGRPDEAQSELGVALAIAPPSALGLVTSLAALLEQRAGHHDDALRLYADALPLLEHVGDRGSIGVVHLNRGVLHAYRDQLGKALQDYARAERIAEEEGMALLSAMAAHNLGFAEGRRGRLADALLALDRARVRYEQLDAPPRQLPVLYTDRAEVLLLAGLTIDARAAAETAVESLSEGGNIADLTEARLVLARAYLAAGDLVEAKRQATAAARGFRATRRPTWAALAIYVGLHADLGLLDPQLQPPARLIERCDRLAKMLLRDGWPLEARDVRTWAARLAFERGDLDRGRVELVAAHAINVRGAGGHRARLCYADALALVSDGDVSGAYRALRRGISEIHRLGSRTGATEVRVEAVRFAVELAQLGVDLALRSGRANQVLGWAERQRATTLHFPRVLPPEESDLTLELARMRRELSVGVVDGGPRRHSGRAGSSAVEQSIREQSMRLRSTSERLPTLSITAIRSTLRGRTLIEFVESGGVLHAVVVTAMGTRLEALGPIDVATNAKDFLLFGLRRLALTAHARVPSALASVQRAAGELDQLLFGRLDVADGPVIIVPTGRLHGIPWLALASLQARDVVVAPSAATWLRAESIGTRPRDRLLFVAGPTLPGAVAEVGKLAKQYGDAVVLTGEHATVASALVEIERADLVQIAAHGRFRADSPMFSNLQLWDGPLTLYDLERLRAAPEVVVLSACEAASVRVYTGDELLGTATALLALGVRTIVAPVLPVPDDITGTLMVAMHGWLRAGAPPAEALRRAGAELRAGGGPHEIVTASSFITIGAS